MTARFGITCPPPIFPSTEKIGQIPGFDFSRFAWSSTENGSRVELQQDRNTKNTYAEIVAQQDNTSIYQNVSTGNGGVLYKIRLKHAAANPPMPTGCRSSWDPTRTTRRLWR